MMSTLKVDNTADPFRMKIGFGLASLSEDSPIRLPTVFECAAHLTLLDAIVRMETDVGEWATTKNIEKDVAWNAYCSAAALRFLKWSQTAETSDDKGAVPPLDILMVWHSYMLNTAAYQRYVKKFPEGRLGGKGIDWGEVYERIGDDNRFNMSTKDQSSMDRLGLKLDLFTLLKNGELLNGNNGPISPPTSLKFDIVAAIQRQLRFARKMHNAQWLFSQFAGDILESAIRRYEMFITLIGERQGTPLAPTQDIDLVWHTHQLSPKRYGLYSAAMNNGAFIHHNDAIAEDRIQESFAAAKTLFRERFGRGYLVCYLQAAAISIVAIDAAVPPAAVTKIGSMAATPQEAAKVGLT
ncbi:hypothetical protein O1611_g2486 [Lasiodiplodia mahajangana]|uniref:Uncharacterized protein n=1 Tax=Lasiodiplodia mahajangana TaxID=1108764 RepID=A0ACC2JUX8_9PEZI|nr:hypothetical protein O1611_g2486 [Lasiodiplodia mahajangana]